MATPRKITLSLELKINNLGALTDYPGTVRFRFTEDMFQVLDEDHVIDQLERGLIGRVKLFIPEEKQ